MAARSVTLVLGALLAAVAAGSLASSADAAATALWPGVTYRSTVELTPRGPVAIHVITGPRPGGLTTLEPLLSNDSVLGRETVTSMQRRVTDGVTAGVNADFSRFDNGKLSGIFMRNGDLAAPPNPRRSSVGILSDGTLDVRRVSLRGTWRGTALHPLSRLNEPPAAGGAAVFTPAFGSATPAMTGATAAILFPFPLVTPGVDLAATVAEVVDGSVPVSIPIGGAVLLASGAQGRALSAEALVGSQVSVRLDFDRIWDGLVSAVGGGPLLVSDGRPVVGANEWFTPLQLVPRAPRSAVGRLANGRVILVAVDGRQPGYSVGLTNAELARKMAALGATQAMGFDSGGSTTIAFDGTLLNRPSDGRERPVGSALVLRYAGAFLPPPLPVTSPDGDGVDDVQTLRYRLTSPSTVTVTLTRPDGSVAFSESGAREPGSYPVAFPPSGEPAGGAPLAEGRWRLRIEATDDLAQPSTMARVFSVNTTLGFVRPERRVFAVPRRGGALKIRWRLTRPARVALSIETATGAVVRSYAPRAYAAGDDSFTWSGLGADGKAIPAGRYVVRVAATNQLGRVAQTGLLLVRRTAT